MTLIEQFLRSKTPLPTSLSSAELRQLDRAVRAQSIFSARTTLLDYVQDIGQNVTDLATGKTNEATARQRLQESLDFFGYTPEKGFPADPSVPPAERESLRDLSSDTRVKLVLQTNTQLAQGYAQAVQGNEEGALWQFPAWELVRYEFKATPRGFRRVKGELVENYESSWERRWQTASNQSGDTDAWRVFTESGRMVARKDSPIWAALGDSELFDDALDTEHPPFAFNSGMGWRAVPRAECEQLGLPITDLAPAQLPQFAAELQDNPDTATLANLRATRDDMLRRIAELRRAA